MKLVNTYGGHSIGVYDPATQNKKKVYKMMHDKRIRYYAPADYTERSELDLLVKAIIDKTAANEIPLSYTHLDVYKRQTMSTTRRKAAKRSLRACSRARRARW